MSDENLDKFIYGAEPIGLEANIVKEDGTVDLRATYHALEMGYIDADKFGRKWRSNSAPGSLRE